MQRRVRNALVFLLIPHFYRVGERPLRVCGARGHWLVVGS
jgi:hypothetical protein